MMQKRTEQTNTLQFIFYVQLRKTKGNKSKHCMHVDKEGKQNEIKRGKNVHKQKSNKNGNDE